MLLFYWIHVFILARFAEINALPTGSHYGTDFYIGMFPYLASRNDIIIDIASQEGGSAVLSVPYLGIHRNVTIRRGATTLNVSGTIMEHGTFVETRAIRVQTDVPVSLFVTTFTSMYIMDTYLTFPVTALGTSYQVASYEPDEDKAFYSVIGINENTTVTTYFRNQTSITTLQQLSVGQRESQADLTGTNIISDKGIAVISGASCARVPHKFGGCDYLLDQMVPVKYWQKAFIVPPVFPKQGFVLKILTNQHEVVCLKNKTNSICNFSSSIRNGETLMGTEPVVVTSAAPMSVVQYGVGQNYDSENGDPFMTVIPGTDNYLNEYYFVVPSVYQYMTNYLSVIVSSSQTQELYLDGSSLSVIKQYNVPDPFSNYTVIIANITVGYHRLWHVNSNVMFGATVYGLSNAAGYGFPVGFAFTKDGQAKCYHCDDMSTLQVCDALQQCEKNQVCYAEKYNSSAGTYFKSGCIDSHQCNLNLTKNPHAVCAECCYDDLCNNKGCGDNSFPDRNHRGPMCYDCLHVMGDPGQCNKVTLCASDEVCSIEQYRWGDNVHYKMGCAHQWCAPIKRSALTERVERSTPLCSHCCSTDFCNHNCTGAGDGASGPAIVG